MEKIKIVIAVLFCLFGCHMEQPFYTQEEIIKDSKSINNLIIYSGGDLLLNTQELKNLFTQKRIKTIDICEGNSGNIRTFEYATTNTQMIQLEGGNTAVIASNEKEQKGFMIFVDPQTHEIRVMDEYSLLAALFFKDLILNNPKAETPPIIKTIQPEALYLQMKEIRSFTNIYYKKYLEFTLTNGLPDDLLPFFILHLSSVPRNTLLTLSWNECIDSDFKQYEVYQSNTPDFTNILPAALITNPGETEFSQSISENDLYFYYINIRKKNNAVRGTNSLGFARFPSGVVLQLEKNQEFYNFYETHWENSVPLTAYFLKTNTDNIHPGGLDEELLLSENFSIRQFIRNEEENFYAWDNDDPFFGYFFIHPKTVQYLQSIQDQVKENLIITTGFRSPAGQLALQNQQIAFHENSKNITGFGINIKTADKAQWFQLARLGEEASTSRISPLYQSFTNPPAANPSRHIYLEWDLPARSNSFIYNPSFFQNGYSVVTASLPVYENGKSIQKNYREVRKNGQLLELIDQAEGHIKVCDHYDTPYFRAELHSKPDNDSITFLPSEHFHQYGCSDCSDPVTEDHTWLTQTESFENHQSIFFDETLHWEDECIYCYYKKDSEEHEIDESSDWQRSLQTHWKVCGKCDKIFNEGAHQFSSWTALGETRLHSRRCVICSQPQVRPHSGWTNYVPYPYNEKAGHAKYCKDCKMSYPYEAPGYDPHDIEQFWSNDEEEHWKNCRICGYKSDTQTHNFTKWIDIGFGRHERNCITCEYREIRRHQNWNPWQQGASDPELGHLRTCEDCGANDPSGFNQYYGHNRAAEWSFDNAEHWHLCTDCNYKVDLSSHVPEEWSFNTETHWQICAVCSYNSEQVNHSFTEWIDLINGTHFRECSTCKYTETEEHYNWSNWLTLPDIHDLGHIRYCGLCGAEDPHKDPGYYPHEPEQFLFFDENNHWQRCTICWESINTVEHDISPVFLFDRSNHWQECTICSFTAQPIGHSFTEWIDLENGTHFRECTTCDHTETENHYDWSNWQTLTETKELGHLRYCNFCGAEDPPEDPGYYPHEPEQNLLFDADAHWQSCTICGETFNTAEHDINPVFLFDQSNHWRQCTTCSFSGQPEEHSFTEWIDLDNGNHFRECTTCDYSETENHGTWSGWQTLPETRDLGHIRYCGICGSEDPPEDPGYYPHEPEQNLLFDADDHWQSCTICGESLNKAEHDINPVFLFDQSNHWQQCTTCSFSGQPEEHSFTDPQLKEDEKYYKNCLICGMEVVIE